MSKNTVAKIQLDTQADYWVGCRIECITAQNLKRTAFKLSSKGYGVAIIGFDDIEYHVLTVTALPEEQAG